MNFSYSVVLPTYKERKNLGILIPDLLQMFKQIKRTCEIVVVDDASDDGTREYIADLKKLGKPIRLIERRKEKGPFSAAVKGTDSVKFPNIVRLDSDRVHEIKDLKKLIALYEENGGEKVFIGSRYIRGSIYRGKPFINKMASRLAGLIINYYVKLPVKDASNNFRVFSKKAWDQIRPKLIADDQVGFVHELILMNRFGYELVEVPTTYIEKRIGPSSLSKRLKKETIKFFKDLALLRQDMVSSNER